MIEANGILVDAVGAFAGALGISFAFWLRWVNTHHYQPAYILGMYLLGVVLILLNLQPILDGTGYWDAARLGLYIVVIALEITVFYDLYDGEPDMIEEIRNRRRRNDG